MCPKARPPGFLRRATHQSTSNRGESIACRNKSLIRGVSKTLPFVQKTKAP
uniref:Uncharacterized protein n=1 Tax=Solanum lycopersicum TaxID=4081 RepID=A0A494GA63_SOLLC